MHLSILLLELGGVILGLAVLARIAGTMGLSPIPLYLLAGLALGEGGVLPIVTADDFIAVGAEIGVILLLFMLGLEYSATELNRNLRTGARAGLLDLVLNFSPGVLAGLLFGWSPTASMFLGGITYMSSSGVIAKVLQDLGWIANRETPVVLSVLVIEDLLMAAYLPLLAVIIAGQGLVTSIISLGASIAAVALVLFVAARHGAVLSRMVFSHSDEALLLSIFGITLVVAGLAERVQVSAAVGAFLVGIALSGAAADRARVLLAPLRDLFAGVFFVFFGLRINPSTIPPVLGAALALALVTAATKVWTGWWIAKRAGIGLRGRARAGTALIARGEFSIAIAGLAISSGVEPRLGPVSAAYVLLLAVLGPLVARLADPVVIRLTRSRRSRPALASKP